MERGASIIDGLIYLPMFLSVKSMNEGEIQNKSKARIVRDGAVVYDGEIMSIFREKNAVKEVKNGLECGISLKDFIDFKEKDIIQSYQIQKIERTI